MRSSFHTAPSNNPLQVAVPGVKAVGSLRKLLHLLQEPVVSLSKLSHAHLEKHSPGERKRVRHDDERRSRRVGIPHQPVDDLCWQRRAIEHRAGRSSNASVAARVG